MTLCSSFIIGVSCLFSVDSGAECMDVELEPTPTQLPWGAEKDRINFPENVKISTSAKPGEFVLQTLFAEYTVLAEKKIAQILDLPAVSC